MSQLRYGVPYQGSKNQIAKWAIDRLPPAETFVDLFAGGCAVTHAAILSGKYQNFLINDLHPNGTTLFYNAIKGVYKNENRWVDRETFHALKDTDPYVALCWSFGNKQTDYLYAKTKEPWKKALWYARVLGDTSLMKLLGIDLPRYDNAEIKRQEQHIREALQRSPMQGGQSEWQLHSLQSQTALERIQHLETLSSYLPNMQITNLDYTGAAKALPSSCVVYCDIPYRNTTQNGYKHKAFDYEGFYTWAKSCPHTVYISEEWMPSGFYEMASIPKRRILCATDNRKPATEKLFVNRV